MPWEIGRSSRTIIEPRPSVIRLSTVQKNCQGHVNTRQNASRRRSASLYQQARAYPQPIVPLRRFPCCSLSLSDVSQTCSQLIHMRFVAALASGLRLEISCESDKKKMNLIFGYDKKFPLTEKMKHASRRKRKKRCVKKSRARQPRRIRNRRDEETSLRIVCAPRVDRLNLCGQFPASASGGQTLSKL